MEMGRLKVLKVFDVDGVGTDFEELLVLRVLLEVPRVRRTLDCRHERCWNLKSVSVEVDVKLAGKTPDKLRLVFGTEVV